MAGVTKAARWGKRTKKVLDSLMPCSFGSRAHALEQDEAWRGRARAGRAAAGRRVKTPHKKTTTPGF